MSFLAPLFLAGIGAAAVPVVLHLLRREPEARVKFPAVRLLRRAPVEYTEKRHLRELLLLALRIAALVLLAVAFARPFFRLVAAGGRGGGTIVALDTSYSMGAPGRFAAAKRLADQAVTSAQSGDRVGVLTFADAADLVARPTGDRALARAAIDSAVAGFGATRYRRAIAAAVQALGGNAGTIVVVTDLQENGWDAVDRTAVPDTVKVLVVDAGAPPPNLAVTAVRLSGRRLVAAIANSAERPRDARVRVEVDGKPASDTRVAIGASGSSEVAFDLPAGGKTAAVSVDDPDGLAADNVRYAILASGQRPSLLIVTGSGDAGRDAFYVQQALSSGAGAFELANASAAQLSAWDASRLSAQAAVLLLSTRGLERRGRETLAAYVRGGGGLLVAAGPDIDADVVSGVFGDEVPLKIEAPDKGGEVRVLAPLDVRHPIFQPFGGNAAALALVGFRQVARVAGGGCHSIARFTGGEPALLDCAPGDGRGLVLASDLNNRWNDFPLRATFVPFLEECVRFLAGAHPRAGEYVVGAVPTGVADRPGVAAVTDASTGSARTVVVNVDPRESNTARLSPDEFQAAIARHPESSVSHERLVAAEQEDRQHLWQYALALMLAALVAEGIVAKRTA